VTALQQLLHRSPRRFEHLVFLHPLIIEDLGEVALAGVGKDRDNQRSRIVELPRELDGQSNVQAGRPTGQDSFLASQPARHDQ
jgi:hypothetical protein